MTVYFVFAVTTLWTLTVIATDRGRCHGHGLLVKPETSNKTSDRAFPVAAATTWNRLPPKVRTATSTQQLCCALKTHLFTLDWSRGSPRRLWLVISTDELWRRLQIEWIIGRLTDVTYLSHTTLASVWNVTFSSSSFTPVIIYNKMLSYRRETALQGAL